MKKVYMSIYSFAILQYLLIFNNLPNNLPINHFLQIFHPNSSLVHSLPSFVRLLLFTMNEDHHEQLYLTLRKLIPPPNPIINKEHSQLPLLQPPAVEQCNSDEAEQSQGEADSLQGMYSRHTPVFEKWPQRQTNRNGIVFFASAFLERTGRDPLHPLGQTIREGNLQFDSCYQGGNLLAAYRVIEAQFDLILQNDLNSGGYTQWFDFTLKNGKHLGTVKLNIVNLYKRQSLFGQGLKPLTRSPVEKGWKRGCHSVEYFPSEMKMERRQAKKYRILSFKYDFIRQDDSVRFCYCLPYTYSQLTAFFGSIDSPKARVKYLGATPLGKVLPMLSITSNTGENQQQKKAIVLIGRQHAGETPSSHILQAIIQELLSPSPSPQNEFLLSRYTFYIFPMINVDGVTLGNYRCNFHGVDLNRVWQSEDSRRHPEVGFVKSELRKLMKKLEVELLIDMHGHSNKINSFFYANSFGKHNMILPAVAARMTPFIDLSECSLAEEETDRASTARVVLGNMIRETGSAYTFQVSLYGGIKQGKKVAFGLEHYQEIAHGLLASMWKMGTELQKQERLLKESLYLRDVRREIRRFENKMNNEVVSDEQAKKTAQIEEKLSLPAERKIFKPIGDKNWDKDKQKQRFQIIRKEQQTQTQIQFEQQDYKNTAQSQPQKKLPAQIHKKKLSFSIRKVAGGDQTSRKLELMSKLRVFGQTFAQELPFGQLPSLLPSLTTAAAQTMLTYRTPRKISLSSNRNSYLGTNFLGKRMGEPSVRRRERIYKSNSARVTQAEVSFSDLIKHNKVSLY